MNNSYSFLKKILHPMVLLRKVVFSSKARFFFILFPDSLYCKFVYYLLYEKKMDLKNPKTFNEKLQWLKLNDRKAIYTSLVDKFAVKEWVANKIGEQYIIPTLGIWKKYDDIDLKKLPDQFVLKCTHDSRGLAICKDKTSFDFVYAKIKLEKSLKHNFYYEGREWPYKNVPPRIIAEKYIEDKLGGLTDYKFFCFDGVPQYCQVIRDRSNQETIDFYDIKWNHMPFVGLTPGKKNGIIPVHKPPKFDEMIGICKKLSYGIPFVRIDLYNIDGIIYFGEMTFYPACGFGTFEPEEWNYKFGDMLKLPQK